MTDMNDLVRRAHSVVDRLFPSALDLLERMISVNSITPNFYTVDRASVIGGESICARMIGAWLAQANFEIHEIAPDVERVNVVALRKGAGGGKSLLLNGHVDTVAPFRPEKWKAGSPWRPLREGNLLYGLGSCDMKGGLAAAALAARAIAEAGITLKGDLHVHAVIGEETGCHDEGVLAPLKAGFTADGAIVAEPSSGRDRLVVAPVSYGLLSLNITVKGIGAHVGNRALAIRPGGLGDKAGVNAVEKLIQIVTALQKLEADWGISKRHPAFPPGAFTMTPAVFHGDVGYPSPGYFADHAQVKYVVWYPAHETPDQIKAEIGEFVHHVAQTDPWLRANPPELEWRTNWPAANTAPDHPLVRMLLEHRNEVLKDQALSHDSGAFEATSDATYIEAAGIPSVVMGPGTLRNAHAMDEHVDITEIRDCARIYTRMILNWCSCA